MRVVRRVAWALSLAALLGCGGGSNRGSGEPPVYFKDTAAYEAQVESFKFSSEQARTMAEKHLKGMESPPYTFVGPQAIVIGDEYVFSSGDAMIGVVLDGVYVNGKTGDVRIHRDIGAVRQ